MKPKASQLYLDQSQKPPRLVCRTGLNPRMFRQISLADIKGEDGWVLPSAGADAEPQAVPWHVTEIFSREEQQHLGGVLPSEADSLPADGGCPPLEGGVPPKARLGLYRLLLKTAPAGSSWPGLFPGGLYTAPPDRPGCLPAWAALPPTLYRFLWKNSPDSNRNRTAMLYNHPDKKGPSAAGYSLAALAYHHLTGEHPLQEFLPEGLNPRTNPSAAPSREEDQDEFLDALRTETPLPAHLRKPEIREDISLFLQSWLDPKTEDPSFRDWAAVLQDWLNRGSRETASEEEREERIRRGKQWMKKNLRHRRRTLFLRRHRVKLTAAALILLPLLVLAVNPFSSPDPPANLEMSPREVARLYYECFNTLNEPAMRDIIKKPLGTADFDNLTNLYSTEKVREGYEGQGGLVRADDWVDRGKPELPHPLNAFGVARLELSRLSQEENRALFLAEYQFWAPRPLSADAGYQGPSYHWGQSRKDRITLIRRKNRWFVDHIERQSKPLDSPEPPPDLRQP